MACESDAPPAVAEVRGAARCAFNISRYRCDLRQSSDSHDGELCILVLNGPQVGTEERLSVAIRVAASRQEG